MNFTEALKTLESQNCRSQDKVHAYQAILSDFQSDSTHEGDENLRSESQRLLKLLSRDVVLSAENIVNTCLEVIQHCLKTSFFRSSQSSDSSQLLQALIRCAQKTPSVDVLKRSLDCLSTQDFATSVLNSQVALIVDMVEAVNTKAKAQSRSVLEESLKLFCRLEEQIPEGLRPFSKRWARFILPGLAAASDVTREKTFNVLVRYKDDLCQAPDLSKHLTKAITSGLAQLLKSLMTKHEIYAMKTWALVVEICGKEFHKGPSINSMLEVIEIGFKSNQQAKCQAFIAWRSLISNFGLDKNVISDLKRIKLLMMVFRYDNAKSESVAVEKMLTWWHFVLNIGQKLMVNFEKIVYPMLQFCVGNSKPSRTALKASTNHPSSLLSPQAGNNPELPACQALQKLGLEAVALLLSKPSASDSSGITWTLEHLPSETFGGSASFTKHATFLLNIVHHIFKNGDPDESLILYTWFHLVDHIKAAMESSTKSELRDIFSIFLTDLHSLVEEKTFKGEILFKMGEVCNTFPVKVLASTAFNVRSTVRGCPALLLSEVLLSPLLMETSSGTESYLKLFSFLVSAGASNVQGALGFLQAVADMLDCNSRSLNSAEQLWKMWNIIAETLQDTIIASNEVNQGDALEYNFGCLHAVLILPVKQHLASRISQTVFKAMVKNWKELYHSFARLSALVPTAEANVCVEETCSKILHLWKVEFKEPSNVEFLASLAQKMLDCVDFSAFATHQGPGAILTLSPSKWARRRQRPMGNLHSFVHFLESLQNTINTLIFNKQVQEKQSNPISLISTANLLVETYTRLFAHINTPALILHSMCILSGPLSSFYRNNAPCNLRLFVPSFFAKMADDINLAADNNTNPLKRLPVLLEKLWHEIALCMGVRYNEPYNSELLAGISPLFEATFLHSRRVIKNQAVTLWNTTFSRAQTLDYPVALKPVLSRVKEKMSIVLPGWINPEDIAIIAESPFSEMSMGMDSQILAPPVLPSMPSPKRPRASMMNRDVSPTAIKNLSPTPAKTSPAKVLTPKQARKLFAPAATSHNVVDLMPEEEFVVINSPVTRKKRLLTEHQKEVLKEKSVLPAMYNNLDASQDVSLMSQFGTETQNENSVTQDVIVINSSNSQDQEKKTSTPAMPPPKSIEKPQPIRISKRLSERSQSKEMDQNEADSSGRLSFASETKTSEVSSALNVSEKDSSKKEDCSSAFPKEIDQSSAVDVQDESPFVMFRQNATKSPSLCVNQDFQTCEKSLGRRVSLRKIHSEDSMSNNEQKMKTLKERQPRRVPLKKLVSPAKNGDRETNKDLNSVCKVALFKIDNVDKISSGVKNLPNEKHGQVPPEEVERSTTRHDHQNFVSRVLSSWSAELVKTVFDKPREQSRESDVAAETAHSLTLVEDTQSPDNLKKQKTKQVAQSITETPTKGEDSSSPHLRSSSARKLFIDDLKKNSDEFPAADTFDEENQQQPKTVNYSITLNTDEDISSQGFQPPEETAKGQAKAHDHHTLLGVSQLVSQMPEDSSTVRDMGSVQEPLVVPSDKEKDNAFHSEGESENFMPLLMPTMTSSTQAQSSLSSSKSSETSSETQASTNDASSLKTSSSSETEFFPAQSTFHDSLKDFVNKRKRRTPKKFSPEKIEMRERHLRYYNKLSDLKKKTKRVAPLLSEKGQKSGVEILKNLPNCSPEIGEITPDMKSPTSPTPPRGHSNSKRKRKLSKEANENSKARKSISPEVDKEANQISDMSHQKGNSFQKAKMFVIEERRKLKGSHLTRSFKSKHLLRTRHKASPPRKLRRLNSSRQVETGEESENHNLLFPHEKERTVRNFSDSDSDDNMPLINLKTFSTGLDSVSVDQGDTSPNKSGEHDEKNQNDSAVSKDDEQNISGLVVSSELESALPKDDSARKALVDKFVSSNTKSAESTPTKTDQALNYTIVDEALSSALSEMIKEISTQQNGSEESQIQAANECTPLLLSEDVDEDMNKLPEESQDHLQAGQSRLSLEVGKEQPVGYVQFEQEACLEKNLPASNAVFSKENVSADCSQTVEKTGFDSVSISIIQNHSEERSQSIDVCENTTSATISDKESLDLNCEEETTQNAKVSVTQDQDEAEKNGNPNSDQFPADANRISSLPTESDAEITVEVNLPTVTEKTTGPKSLLHDWSPSKSPSFSILKKSTGHTPSPGRNRVSFAEPVVNGESPIREKYHVESMPTSPLISKSSGQRRGTPFSRSLGKVSGYKRRLGQSARQVRLLQGPDSLPASPTKSQSQSSSQYKATQESQLDSKNPIFPDLIDCSKPVDDILPQLTSSLWYRGLHHMMKGRSLNTIGDLAALTEVQINQLPIRHPKVDTVKTSLKTYMAQHGLFKPVIKLNTQDVSSSPTSKGATMEQAVTPSSIADEGIEIRSHDNDLDRLSPIEGVGPELCPTVDHSNSGSSQEDGECSDPTEANQTSEPNITSTLNKLVEDTNNDGGILKSLNTLELLDIHEKLNHLFAAVVGEMKSRHSQSS